MGSSRPIDRYRRLPSGWYSVEWETDLDNRIDVSGTRPDRPAVDPTPRRACAVAFQRRGSALAALDRALAVDARKPIGLALGSGLEGALDLSAVTANLNACLEVSSLNKAP